MNYKISFKEMAKRGKKILENQKPVTLEEAKEQVKWLKENSKNKGRRKEEIKKGHRDGLVHHPTVNR